MALNPLVTGVLSNLLDSSDSASMHQEGDSNWGASPASGSEVAMEDWRKPYVKQWIKHNNPNDPFIIKDKDYLKNLQNLVIFHRPI